MILNIFKNAKKFTLLFFLVLLIDILVKLNCPVFPYRLISKPLVVLLLFGYYLVNNEEENKGKFLLIILALTCFLMGDLFFLNYKSVFFFSLSLISFSFGKIFLCLRFSHKTDFNVSRLITFSIIVFVYVVFLISLIFDGLKAFFIPVLISFFLSLLMLQFAFLRKGVANKKSYLYVFFGVLVFIMGESIMAIKTFKMELPFHRILTMLLYGTSVYLVIMGIVNEKYNVINPSEPVADPTN